MIILCLTGVVLLRIIIVACEELATCLGVACDFRSTPPFAWRSGLAADADLDQCGHVLFYTL